MRVGTVRERKDGEARVGLTPEGAFALTADGHDVVFEAGCGEKSGHSDAAYVASGGQPLATADEVWALSLIHISEPTRLLSISYAVFCLKKKNTPTISQPNRLPIISDTDATSVSDTAFHNHKPHRH